MDICILQWRLMSDSNTHTHVFRNHNDAQKALKKLLKTYKNQPIEIITGDDSSPIVKKTIKGKQEIVDLINNLVNYGKDNPR